MKCVLKWPIPLDSEWHEVPAIREGFFVAMQEGRLMLWAVTDLATETETTRVRVFATGTPYANTCRYLGTALDGPFVWHLIEAERSP